MSHIMQIHGHILNFLFLLFSHYAYFNIFHFGCAITFFCVCGRQKLPLCYEENSSINIFECAAQPHMWL